jgi:hypothetical protein
VEAFALLPGLSCDETPSFAVGLLPGRSCDDDSKLRGWGRAVQLARHAGTAVVESGPADLVFDTRGGEVPAGERVVTIAEEMPGAMYFIVDPDHEQLLELRTLVDAGVLRAEIDSVFPLTEARAPFERVAGRGKRGKVVLEVGTDQLTGAAVTPCRGCIELRASTGTAQRHRSIYRTPTDHCLHDEQEEARLARGDSRTLAQSAVAYSVTSATERSNVDPTGASLAIESPRESDPQT